MPGSFDSEGTSSPSLIQGSLRNFRFQGQGKASPVPRSSPSVIESSSDNSIEVIPETPPEIQRTPVVSSSDSKQNEAQNSFSGRLDKSNSKQSSMSNNNSSHTVQMADSVTSPTKGTGDEYDVFCEKEHCLRELLKHFPTADIMEAQDLLVNCRWDLDQAIQMAKENPLKESRRRLSLTSQTAPPNKGVVYGDTSTSRYFPSSTDPDAPEEIVLDSDEDNGIYVAPYRDSGNTNTSSSIGVNGSSWPARNRNKKQRIVSDESDDDDISLLPMDGANLNNSFNNSQLPSTSFTGQRKRITEFSYSKTQRKQHSERKVDRTVFSDSPHKVKKREKKVKPEKRKRRREYSDVEDEDLEDYGNYDVYDSEESDVEENLTPARSGVLSFFQDAVVDELATIPGCSKKKAELIAKLRPFNSWVDLVAKINSDKTLSGDLLNGAKKVLDMRTAINRLMNKCQRISLEMEDLVEALKENKEDCKDYVSKQPGLLNSSMHLTPYQMLGLNWLLLMHNQEVNGILADEMGLGKTIQAIAFLAYLKEQDIAGPHLIVVPSSTLDNWQNELHTWWPSVSILCYHGSQEFRRELRAQIIEDNIEEFDVMVTTYNMVTSSSEDRSFFRKLQFNYVIFDEAHMLKNMASQRYQHLMRVKADRRLLLTGTPLQNNLIELMSLLIFAMPHMFSGKTEQVKQMFSAVSKTEEGKSRFERDKVEHAKRIMKPFVLRRLKRDVLKDLPTKHEEIKFCQMSESQAEHYRNLVTVLSEEVQRNKEKEITTSGSGMMMQLRKAANHPLLLRIHYDDEKLAEMAKLMLKEPTHCEANPDLIFEDMQPMFDFELNRLCKQYKSLKSFRLEDEKILNSGKFAALDSLLSPMISQGSRILLFSQFTMVLDIIEEYMRIRKHKYLRLDGQIPVSERQHLIDEYNQNSSIPIFLLSTRAGGLGINLTAANVVIIHDIDFNPYNDKQAEDRCHRVGQLRDVTVIRLISEDTIEEGMLQRAKEKLKLERDVTASNDDEEKDSASVATLLRDALGLPHQHHHSSASTKS